MLRLMHPLCSAPAVLLFATLTAVGCGSEGESGPSETGGNGNDTGSGGTGAGASPGGGSENPGGTGAGTNAGSGGETDPGSSGGAKGSTGGSGSGAGGSSVPPESEVDPPSEPLSDFIVVDQFGYLPESEKIAVVRVPAQGFDAGADYTPAERYRIMNAVTGEAVLELEPVQWKGGQVHQQSGDRAYHLDFSEVRQGGVYYVLDAESSVRSALFRISNDVYRDVLKHAVRTFFYQRAGFAKEAKYAGAAWEDGASHVRPGQDKDARLYSATNDASTARDVSGGWYDAGDYNKYTPWTADYVVTLLRAYEENPGVFGDDYGLPESGNGVSDLLDEVRFGLEHLIRLQNEDGSVLSIVDLDHGSPPSEADGPSRYGPPSTNATVRAGTAYAIGARIFADVDEDFASDLEERAESAWEWASENPEVIFYNNDGTNNLGAGQQELDWSGNPAGIVLYKNNLAMELYRLTGDKSYLDFLEQNYDVKKTGTNNAAYNGLNYYVAGWEQQFHDTYLLLAKTEGVSSNVSQTILERYVSALGSDDNFGMLAGNPDPYLAFVADYTWGSNAHKSRTGLVFYSALTYDLDPDFKAEARRAAERYIHYIHGVNPLGLVYLSNMGESGAEKSVTQFYHSWFGEGTPWDEVGVSEFGPPPGFLAGGPNPSYDWDGCCETNSCGTSCGAAPPSPPAGQPAMKSYAQFNDGWPLNSWAVTENSNGYQVEYIRLLSKFVE